MMTLSLNRNFLLGLFFSAVSLLAPASANVVFVSPSGNDANSGLSWVQAKQTVAAGLNTAVSGDEVWVAAGTYSERITLKIGVALYGGFVGTEANLGGRAWKANVTILDGQNNGNVVTSPYGATATTRIDGFTIRNGTGIGGLDLYGGGIYCSHSSPSIVNNTISGNNATEGGGILCESSSPSITDNIISGNSASDCGGGILCYDSSSPSIANNTISENEANEGGGIFCQSSSPLIANNLIFGNVSTYHGGGIECMNLCPYSIIINNTISGNISSDDYGGGINGWASSSNVTIANNIIAFNSSGICWIDNGSPALRNNCVYNPGGEDYRSLLAGPGDISVDPLFVNQSNGDFHLTEDSQCIDAGNNAGVQSGWVDMDHQDRIINTHVDIGADEYDPPRPTIQIDGRVVLGDWPLSPEGVLVNVQVQCGSLYEFTDVPLNADGWFSVSFQVDRPYPPTCNVRVKGSHWLAVVQEGIGVQELGDGDIPGGTVIVTPFSLVNGDCNNDNKIDVSDNSLMSSDWYNAPPTIVGTDLNGDGVVDELDLSILTNNWHLEGDEFGFRVCGTVAYNNNGVEGYPLDNVTIELHQGSTVESHNVLLRGTNTPKTYRLTTSLTGACDVVIPQNNQTGWFGDNSNTNITLSSTTTVNFSLLHALPGDVNMDNVVDGFDIDLLYDAIWSRISFAPKFDVNGSSTVDQDDMVYLLYTILGSEYGDADLSGSVDEDDYNNMLFGYQNGIQEGMSRWTVGDFDGSGIVDEDDYNFLLFGYENDGPP
jgi:parallel beta-helix repeat protein